MIRMPITHWHHLSDYEVNQLQQVLTIGNLETEIPREWTPAYGHTLTGYHIVLDENGEECHEPMYSEQIMTQEIDVREYTGYSTGELTSGTASTDMGWWD